MGAIAVVTDPNEEFLTDWTPCYADDEQSYPVV